MEYVNTAMIQVVLFLFGAVIISWIARVFFNRLTPRLVKSQHVWDVALLKAMRKPFVLFIWLITISLIYPIIVHQFDLAGALTKDVATVRRVLLLLALFWFLMSFVQEIEKAVVHRTASGKTKLIQDKTTVHAISQLARIVIIFFVTLTFLQSIGLDINALLAFGGVGGIAIGFAARDTLANFIGGMMVYWDRPFSVGDWISSPDRNIEGTVEHIGWRLTRIRTFDKRPLYVPNGVFSTISVENPSRMLNRRIKALLGLRYDDADKIAAIVPRIKKMLQEHPDIDPKQTLMVHFVDFAPSSLNMQIYCFTKTTDWNQFLSVQQDVFLKAMAIISEEGAQCAYPTTTLHVPKGLIQKPNGASSNGD